MSKNFRFLREEDGGMGLDWVVLTGLLVGTTLAIVGTFANGVEDFMEVGPHVQLRGEVVQPSFDARFCPDGIDALQAREDARAARSGAQPIAVRAYMEATYADKSAASIRAEWERARDAAAAAEYWSVEGTLLGAVECELALRGLD
jgi:hypothetical protein